MSAFLEFACWDQHVSGRGDHRRADRAAQRLLAQDPALARESIYTATVCGGIDEVRSILASDPAAARARGGPRGWTPLLYLAFTRFTHEPTLRHAVEIARLLLDHGAEANDSYSANGVRCSALVGAAGEGEGDAPRQPWGPALFDLLLERGGHPFDQQVLYNTQFHHDVLWWLELVYRRTKGTPLAAAWRDPDWHMFDMGNYGTGAQFLFHMAKKHQDEALRTWLVAHGARPMATAAETPRPEPDARYRLAMAARLNDVEEVTRLLDSGVPVDISDGKRMRALHVAAATNAVDTTRVLLERGADVDAPEERFGAPPIGIAAHHDHRNAMDLLAPRSTSMFVLCANGYLDRVRELLAEDPSRATQTNKGETLLFWLPDDDELAVEMADLLLAKGADPGVVTADGRTAASKARRLGLPKTAERLDARR